MGWGTGNIGGGGASLNFKVVGGTTAPPNPKENTIWVNTSTSITSWIFSATEPEPPEDGKDGLVWFETGTSGEVTFNALKKNGIKIYPKRAKQCVGGKFEDIPAFCRQDGIWVKMLKAVYIFKEGVGLFEGYEAKFSLGTGVSTPVTKEKIVWATSESQGNNFWIEPNIDVTQFSKLYYELALLKSSNNAYKATVGVGESAPSGLTSPGDFLSSVPDVSKGDRNIYEVNLINVNTSVYIKLAGVGTTGEIYNIWLE